MYLLSETRFENPFTQEKNVWPKVAFLFFGKSLHKKNFLQRIFLMWFTFSQKYLLRINCHILHFWHILRIYYRSILIVVISNQWRFHTYLINTFLVQGVLTEKIKFEMLKVPVNVFTIVTNKCNYPKMFYSYMCVSINSPYDEKMYLGNPVRGKLPLV